MEHSGGCAGTAEYYRSTGEAVPVQKSTIRTLGTMAHYKNTREAVLVQ